MERLQQDIVNAFARLTDALLSVIPAALVLLASLLLGLLVGGMLRALFGLLSRLALGSRGHPGGLRDRFLKTAGLDAGFERVAGAVSFWVGVAVVLAVGVNALE